MKKKWWIYSVTGLLLLGFGLSLLGEAIIYKINNDFNWFYWGTTALVVFNSGIALVGEAIALKGKMTNPKH
jgi:quinol-cytochrome oxidoreductase complex cytochrome b subunit